MNILPDELIFNILTFLDLKTLFIIGLTIETLEKIYQKNILELRNDYNFWGCIGFVIYFFFNFWIMFFLFWKICFF